jgi:hypothetical protein
MIDIEVKMEHKRGLFGKIVGKPKEVAGPVTPRN